MPRHKLAKPTRWQQLALFDLDMPPELVRQIAARVDLGDLVQRCEPVVAEHAARHGWTNRQSSDVRRSLRLLQVLLDGPDDTIRATDVLQLPGYGGNVISTLDVLQAAGLLNDDRVSNVERYFAGKTNSLPTHMRDELEVWLRIMLDGSPTAPRRRARDPQTARLQIMGLVPILQAWADAGHQSLAAITHEQVMAAIPETGTHRHLATLGMRSLFTILKGQKLIFTNPTRGMKTAKPNRTIPMPQDTDAIRAALNSPDPAIALAVALVAFHALADRQLRALRLTDIVDGTLTIGQRSIPLANPVRVRLSAWLNHRNTTWPMSQNPHLFISRVTATRLTTVGNQFPFKKTNVRPQALREDRILQEITPPAATSDASATCSASPSPRPTDTHSRSPSPMAKTSTAEFREPRHPGNVSTRTYP